MQLVSKQARSKLCNTLANVRQRITQKSDAVSKLNTIRKQICSVYPHTYERITATYLPVTTWISMSIGAFDTLFRAIDRANSGVQVNLAVLGTISRYSEHTVCSKTKLLCGVIHVPQQWRVLTTWRQREFKYITVSKRLDEAMRHCTQTQKLYHECNVARKIVTEASSLVTQAVIALQTTCQKPKLVRTANVTLNSAIPNMCTMC